MSTFRDRLLSIGLMCVTLHPRRPPPNRHLRDRVPRHSLGFWTIPARSTSLLRQKRHCVRRVVNERRQCAIVDPVAVNVERRGRSGGLTHLPRDHAGLNLHALCAGVAVGTGFAGKRGLIAARPAIIVGQAGPLEPGTGIAVRCGLTHGIYAVTRQAADILGKTREIR